jgi:hypothetical protein
VKKNPLIKFEHTIDFGKTEVDLFTRAVQDVNDQIQKTIDRLLLSRSHVPYVYIGDVDITDHLRGIELETIDLETTTGPDMADYAARDDLSEFMYQIHREYLGMNPRIKTYTNVNIATHVLTACVNGVIAADGTNRTISKTYTLYEYATKARDELYRELIVFVVQAAYDLLEDPKNTY